MIGIYKITNTITNQCYIGQSTDIKKRWKHHKYEARTGERQAPLYCALREYGIENFSFEVLEECPQELLNEKEIFWIAYYKSNDRDFGYNVRNGGQNGVAYGYQRSAEKVESMPIVPVSNGKMVRCINTNQIFHSACEAARWCNQKDSGGVRGCCIGKYKTAGKHPDTGERLKWEYVE